MDAHLTPQDAVNRGLPKPSQCDAVVVILWSRMGTPLPDSYDKKPDGTPYLSGTEWEFEDALAESRRILLYRRTEEPRLGITDSDFKKKRKQYQLVQKFFKRFEGADGSLTGGYTPYQTVEGFEKRFRLDIEGLLRQLDDEKPKGGGHGRAARATAAPVTQAYRVWLKSECGGVELLGMRLRHGQAVRLNHIYVPLITTVSYVERIPQLPKERQESGLSILDRASLYLSGAPGSGKSTFCRWVAWLVSEGAMPAHEVDPPQKYAERFPEALRGHFPVLVRLRDFWRFLPQLSSGSDLSGPELEQALVRWLASRHLKGLAAEELYAHLKQGTALLILDGVDEVPLSVDGDQASWAPRSLLISGLKHGCPDWTKKGNRILLTSRPYGLTADDTPQELSHVPIEPLPTELQTLLVQRWFRVLADTKEAAQETASDMQAHLAKHRWLEPLTANPLLLTAMCIIYDEGKRLPQDKHDLYDRIIDTVLHGRYRDPVAKDAARNRLGVIAHGMHTGEGLGEMRTTPQAEATYAEIVRMLKTYQDSKPWKEAGDLGALQTREELLSNSGLLLSRGEKRAGFYHFSFQEFLAAQRILDLAGHSLLDVFRERSAAPEWRNTLSLLFGRVLGISVSPEKGISLMRNMIDAISPGVVSLQLVAADCIETLLAKGIRLPKDQESRLQEIFLQAMRSNALAFDRASLGNALARLGDPRPEVMTVDAMPVCFVPAGPFFMGSDDSDKDASDAEKPHNPSFDIPYSYGISQYPVTNAQFQEFVDDNGYAKYQWWAVAKDHGVWKEGKVTRRFWFYEGEKYRYEFEEADRPADFGVPFNLPNHPVVGVCWYEALAFTEWLSARWQSQGWLKTGERIQLPNEPEWEKVACGGLRILSKPVVARIGELSAHSIPSQEDNPSPKRRYPWGDDPDPNRANYADTGINATSAPGCFWNPEAPYGCQDMAGNVWEWTRSLWGPWTSKEGTLNITLKFPYPYTPQDGREDLYTKLQIARVLRGGAFFSVASLVRCAFRDTYDPDYRNDYIGFRVVVSPFFSER